MPENIHRPLATLAELRPQLAADVAESASNPAVRNDPRYPRSRGFSLLRALARKWFLALLAYPAYVVLNLVALVATQGFGALLSPTNLLTAALLDLLIPYLGQHLFLLAPIALVGGGLTWFGLLAHRDYEHEKAELERRKIAHHVGEHVETIVAAGSRDLRFSPTPEGPPLDFSLLPEPEHFVGREGDLAWVEQRLRQGGTSAIVAAIAGLGGIGKTALAAVAVRRLYAEGRFKDGIAVVSCLGRGDAAGVLRDVLLRFVPQQEVPPEATLNDLATLAVARLSGRDALVVLDNVEPELSLGGVLQPLRDAHLTVLLTARQTLPLPPRDRRALDLLSEAAALDLFAEWYGRANAAALSPAEHAAAQRIVTALGRHTLAVKLAGAQAVDLKLPLDDFAAQVAAHPLDLEDQGADATLALKERLMRSVDALPIEGELGDVRCLFAALAALATPARAAGDPDRVTLVPSLEFGRQAAAAVGNALDLPDPDRALDLLLRRALLDKTTDETLPAAADRERLRLHPLLRELAAELLDDPTRAAASLAIAAFYADYVDDARVPDTALAPDAENIAGALEWAHEHAPDEERDALVSRICNGMRNFWRDRSRTRDSLRYLPWGIQAADAIAHQTGDPSDFRRAGNIRGYFGQVLQSTGRLAEAERIFTADLTYRRQAQDRLGESVDLTSLGVIVRRRGQLVEADSYFQRALLIDREVQNRRGEAVVLHELGQLSETRGQPQKAEDYFQQSLAIAREVRDRRGEATVLLSLGQIALQFRGMPEEAEDYFQQSLAIAREVRDRDGESTILSCLGEVAHARGLLEEAEDYFQQALLIDREVQNRQGEGMQLGQLGFIALDSGKLDEAERYFRECLVVMHNVQNALNEGIISQILGKFLIVRRGKRDEGCVLISSAVRIFHQMGVPDEQMARAMAGELGCDLGE